MKTSFKNTGLAIALCIIGSTVICIFCHLPVAATFFIILAMNLIVIINCIVFDIVLLKCPKCSKIITISPISLKPQKCPYCKERLDDKL